MNETAPERILRAKLVKSIISNVTGISVLFFGENRRKETTDGGEGLIQATLWTSRRFWFAFAGAFIAMYFLAFLFHEVMARSFVHETFGNVVRPGAHHENMWGITVSYILTALGLAWIWPRFKSEGSVLSGGLVFGLIIGLIMHIPAAFALYATMDLTFQGIMLDKAWHVLEVACGGITVALILQR